ncbi:MAG: Xaa-Pro peptidase family protein [Treponema sp.]|nr:Xaa-Pro peptidase family protein [Treponema sp.]
MSNYKMRREKIWDWMLQEDIALAMFEDFEPRRDTTVRWLTGQPGDALLFLSAERSDDVGRCLLMPWDTIIANAYAKADMVVPYNNYGRSPLKAIRGAVEMLGIPPGSKIEIPPTTPYPVFLNYVGELSDFDIICREKSVAEHALDLRTVKDADEIATLRKAADVTNKIIDLLEKKVRSGKIRTEADAAMLIELESRKRGCDGTGFETLAAGPDRSFGIHAFPAWTAGPFAGPGLSILDFGLRFHGYNTDVTLTFVRDPSPQQQKMVNLVEEAAKIAENSLAAGNNTMFTTTLVEDFFAKSKKSMVHGLGHGVGLDVHEYPFLRNRHKTVWELKPGMVISVEPGLYDPVHGGCRLENDFLITDGGCEVLTEARIIRL